jgi:threonine/homoserine/homoserine lactone efflux protein
MELHLSASVTIALTPVENSFMLNLPNLPVFLLAALLLLLTPGPAVLYIIARSLDQGRLAGFVSVLSIESGNLVHVLAATLGLSAILVSSALAFSIVKYLGAAYLIYLGVRRLLTQESPLQQTTYPRKSLSSIYRQGVLVAVLNPKTALFFFAFLPQFVDSSKGSVPLQLLSLGCIFVLMAICTDGLYSVLAGTAGKWFAHTVGLGAGKSAPAFLRIERFAVGSIYIGLGVLAALAGVRHP